MSSSHPETRVNVISGVSCLFECQPDLVLISRSQRLAKWNYELHSLGLLRSGVWLGGLVSNVWLRSVCIVWCWSRYFLPRRHGVGIEEVQDEDDIPPHPFLVNSTELDLWIDIESTGELYCDTGWTWYSMDIDTDDTCGPSSISLQIDKSDALFSDPQGLGPITMTDAVVAGVCLVPDIKMREAFLVLTYISFKLLIVVSD